MERAPSWHVSLVLGCLGGDLLLAAAAHPPSSLLWPVKEPSARTNSGWMLNQATQVEIIVSGEVTGPKIALGVT